IIQQFVKRRDILHNITSNKRDKNINDARLTMDDK
ncbi:unnamed protein product, partial [Heterotrigona itama]